MFASRFDSLPPSPFPRLRTLLEGIEPAATPIDLGIGEPKHAVPQFLRAALDDHFDEYNRYPPAQGTPELRQAIAGWAARRYGTGDMIDADRHVVPLCGSREGLFNIALVCIPETAGPPPAVLMPNPFYQCYGVGAAAAGAEPVFLPTPRGSGFLPDLDAIDDATLARTSLFYFCSPANPQGAVANLDDLMTLIERARHFGFTVLFDECYSEIYLNDPPPGALDAARELGGSLENIVIFNSLSKRSNLAGLRSGFCIGDAAIMSAYLKFRNLAAPQMPLPVQAAATLAWNDEAHVEENRNLYRVKIRLAEELLAGRYEFYAPEGGFFLWLDMSDHGGGQEAARTLWREAGLRVVPGDFLARDAADGGNDNAAFVRVALVHDEEITGEALQRMTKTLD